MGSFDDEISELFADHEDAKGTLEKSKAREENDRQVFLRSFRDKLLNIVTPVFVSVEKNPAAALSLFLFKVGQEENGHAGYLKVTTGRGQEHRLVFSADYNKKRVSITKRQNPHRVIELDELTERLVQEEVKVFLREVLEGQRR